MSKKRRKLRPHETARRDQAMARARDAAKDTRTGVVITEDAEPGVQCSWCDCPDDPSSPHEAPGYVCGGCPRDAAYVTSVLYGTPAERRLPTCEAHYRDMVRTVARWLGYPPVEFVEPWEDER